MNSHPQSLYLESAKQLGGRNKATLDHGGQQTDGASWYGDFVCSNKDLARAMGLVDVSNNSEDSEDIAEAVQCVLYSWLSSAQTDLSKCSSEVIGTQDKCINT